MFLVRAMFAKKRQRRGVTILWGLWHVRRQFGSTRHRAAYQWLARILYRSVLAELANPLTEGTDAGFVAVVGAARTLDGGCDVLDEIAIVAPVAATDVVVRQSRIVVFLGGHVRVGKLPN